MNVAIIIPSRHASVRLPGKSLVKIAGQTLLERVVRIAQAAAEGLSNVSVVVATDHDDIAAHCKELVVDFVMTDPNCPSGTDRAAAAVAQLKTKPDFVLNFQGDAALTPPDFLRAMIDSYAKSPCDVLTPVTQMSWAALDKLRESKKTTPFSGTTAIFDQDTGEAFWFSKNIIPAMRKEDKLREAGEMSPVWRHIGLYGYSCEMLERYTKMPESRFEKLEGLEQLRVIENGYKVRCVPVDYRGRASMSGIDSPEDVTRAEELIAKHGELISAQGKAA
jgi:3-deoxy-manno-octulosonate cytidylyltransferase (CMP-KDO synthetase)